MADRSILFSAPMVRAILREIECPGTGKTQTRRVLDAWCDEPPAFVRGGVIMALDCVDRPYRWPRTHAVGDRLWVREAWKPIPASKPGGYFVQGSRFYERDTFYRADDDCPLWANAAWKPSIHMPRKFSRLTLTVTDVRVERLQDISEADAIAEGVERLHHGWFPYGITTFMTTVVDGREVPAQYCSSARDSYRLLWDNINGAGAWDANPWVAAYTLAPERRAIDFGGRPHA